MKANSFEEYIADAIIGWAYHVGYSTHHEFHVSLDPYFNSFYEIYSTF